MKKKFTKLAASIGIALTQSSNAETEVAIDNGSSDDSIQNIKNSFKKINYIYINNNLGYAKGYNYAFNHLRNKEFEYYLILNNDTIVIKKLLTIFARRQPPQKSTKNLGRVHVVVNLSPKACGLTARRSFTHCWQKDYLSASG